MPELEDAILLAVQAHRGQRDRVGQPYILHVFRVMLRMVTEEERTAAMLHDVVEDTSYTLDQLQALGYAPEIIHTVDCLTRREDETYEAFVERAGSDPMARRVKLADLEDNMDLRRLSALREHDLDRLNRYLRAWRALNGLE